MQRETRNCKAQHGILLEIYKLSTSKPVLSETRYRPRFGSIYDPQCHQKKDRILKKIISDTFNL